MQVVSFQVPRLYEDISFRIGGLSYDFPFATIKNQKVIPFNQSDFEGVDRRPNTEDLKTFFGINDNSPAPPTLNMTGRGRNLLNASRLASLNTELTPIYGYPAWLYLSLKDWVKYEMQKQNQLWLAQNGLPEINDFNEKLKSFASNFAKNQALVGKLQFLLSMPDFVVKKQLQEPFFFFNTLPDGAEYKKKYQPAIYVNAENKNLDVIEVLLPKKLSVDYIKYLHFTAVGDKSIDLTAWNTQKNNNDFKIDLYFVAPTHTFLPFAQYPLFNPFPNLTQSNESYSLTIFYEEAENPKNTLLEKPKPKPKFKPKFILTEPEAEPETPEPTLQSIQEPPTTPAPTASPHWLWLLILFVILLITLQKASQ